MHAEKTRPHGGNVSRNPGREAVRRNGERRYINHRPAFAVAERREETGLSM